MALGWGVVEVEWVAGVEFATTLAGCCLSLAGSQMKESRIGIPKG